MAKHLAIDNSKLREEARQRRQEQARLQQPSDKQPAKPPLFGPPIPVSRPNDPTFQRLSNFFGSYDAADVLAFRSFSNSSNPDSSSTDQEVNAPKLVEGRNSTNPRNPDSKRSDRPSGPRHNETRQGDTRQNDARRSGGDLRHNDVRHGDSRHGDMRHSDVRQRDAKPNDDRNGISNNATGRNSSSGHSSGVPLENNTDHARQGVFDQFGGLKAPPANNTATSESRNGGKSSKHDRPDSSSSGFRQNCSNGKPKSKTVTTVDSRGRTDSRSEESSGPNQSNGSTNSRPEHQSVPTHVVKTLSSPVPPNPALTPSSSSSRPRNRDVRSDSKNSTLNSRTDSVKEPEKPSSGGAGTTQTGQRNGHFKSTHDVHGSKMSSAASERKLLLRIPSPSEENEKFDDFVTKLIQEVSIPSPLTAIMTPKKSEIFPFPDLRQSRDKIIPKDPLLNDTDVDKNREFRDEETKVEVDDVSRLHQPSSGQNVDSRTLLDHGKVTQSTKDLLLDLEMSSDSSDSDDEQVKENSTGHRTPEVDTAAAVGAAAAAAVGAAAAADSQNDAADQKPIPMKEGQDLRVRRLSESSEASISEGSCSSESDSSQSDSEDEDDDEDDKKVMKLDPIKTEEEENEDKQSKSWEIKNFIPKGNEQVPLPFGLSPSPLLTVNRQTSSSHDGYQDDAEDPIKMCMSMLSPRLMKNPHDAEQPESSNLSVDIVQLLNPTSRKSPASLRTSDHLPLLDFPEFDIPTSENDRKSCSPSPLHSVSFPVPVAGVDYRNGVPSVVVRIQRSYLANRLSTSAAGKTSTTTCSDSDGSAASRRSSARTDYKSPAQGGNGGGWAHTDMTICSSAKHGKPSNATAPSLPRTPSKQSRTNDTPTHPTPATTPKRSLPVPSPIEPVPGYRKELRIERSPGKAAGDKATEARLSTTASKAVKRKSDDVDQVDAKKFCERSSSQTKDERKSQFPVQNGDQGHSQKQPVADPRDHLKSPVAVGEDEGSGSRSSTSSSKVAVQKQRLEKSKSQNGHSKPDNKPRKAASSSRDVGKDGGVENTVSNSNKSTKSASTSSMSNGFGKSPAYFNVSGIAGSGEMVGGRKRSADSESDDRLPSSWPKDPTNGIKRDKYQLERLESSDIYMQQARKLKHEGNSGPDIFSKVMSYMESILAFVCHCSALEAEHAESTLIQKILQDTLALCQYVFRVMDGITIAEKYHLRVICLRIQSIICLRLYNIRKIEAVRLKSVLDEHNKNHASKPLQIPSPYQASHHHSANANAASWNHTNGGTPSPRSPRPSPSPAGSIGSVGSAGSSNGDSAMARPSSLVNGHSHIVVPQRIHSIMMNYLSHMNYLHQCHDYWDQSETILTAHPSVGELFRTLDVDFGPMDLHSSTLSIVHYASQIIKHVRNESKRLSQNDKRTDRLTTAP